MTCPSCEHIIELEHLLNPKSRSAITKKDASVVDADTTEDIVDAEVIDEEDDADVNLGDDFTVGVIKNCAISSYIAASGT